MKLFVCFPLEDQETGVAIIDAAEERGHEVTFLDANIYGWMLFDRVNEVMGDIDLLLISRTMGIYGEIMKIRRTYPSIPVAMWNMDVREDITQWGGLLEFAQKVDFYFTVGEGAVEPWKCVNKNSFWVPQGIQDKRYFKVTPEDKHFKKYGHDATFIGNCYPNLHTNRPEILAALDKSDLDYAWIKGVYGMEHNYVVGCAKVNIACSMCPHLKNYFSVRNWKVIAAGGILLEQWRPGIHDLFEGNLMTYTTPEDCVEKVHDVLDAYDEHKKTAEELRVWALEKHTYKNRIDLIEKIVFGENHGVL